MMATSDSRSHSVEIGQVFTPLVWAEWLLTRWSVFDAWVAGASVCDPTAGEGAFALALFRMAERKGVAITTDLLSRLTLIEKAKELLDVFRHRALCEFSVEFPTSNLIAQDIITDRHAVKYDILVGNPPWANFADLPAEYKELLKSHFITEGLVTDKKRVLLGSSRTDIAALVMKIVLGRLLNPSGFGIFFLPLSLFIGDDAHTGFRDYIASHRCFSVDNVYEFSSTKVFDGVGTAYCCARFDIDVRQRFPVHYFRESLDGWIEHVAMPLKKSDDQWRVVELGGKFEFEKPIGIKLGSAQQPRQGVNTCGANGVFIFGNKPPNIPDKFLYPLATKELWREERCPPQRWILLPYDPETGKPLKWSVIDGCEELRDYLADARPLLESRKGTLIQSAILKGQWWSLLGVGPYSFAPYKVVWEAYGQKHFHPIILHDYAGRTWQANQAMHAFIPCWTETDAKRIHQSLMNPDILLLLKQLNGEGRCNWAQPGKIKKILCYETPECHQTALFAE